MFENSKACVKVADVIFDGALSNLSLVEIPAIPDEFFKCATDSKCREALKKKYRLMVRKKCMDWPRAKRQLYVKHLNFAIENVKDLWTEPKYKSMISTLYYRIAQECEGKDPRKKERIIYQAPTVLMAMMLCQLGKHNTCKEIADYMALFNPYLQLLVPCMPTPDHNICSESVRQMRLQFSNQEFVVKPKPKKKRKNDKKSNHRQIDEKPGFKGAYGDALENIFKEFFRNPKITSRAFVTDDNEIYLLTIGFDGQVLRASVVKGDLSAKAHGGVSVALHDCDTNTVLDVTVVDKKNNESAAFIKMLENLSMSEEVIIVCDALNSRDEVVSGILGKGYHYLLTIKRNLGYDQITDEIVLDHLKQIRKPEFTHELENHEHGRHEQKTFSFYNAADFPKLQAKTPSAQTVIVVKSALPRCIQGADGQWIEKEGDKEAVPEYRVYICDLELNKKNFKQMLHSIDVRWNYEAHHHSIDTSLDQDNQRLQRHTGHCDFVAKFNKIIYNIVQFCRISMPENGELKGRPLKGGKDAKIYVASFERCRKAMTNNPLMAMKYLLLYLTCPNLYEVSEEPNACLTC